MPGDPHATPPTKVTPFAIVDSAADTAIISAFRICPCSSVSASDTARKIGQSPRCIGWTIANATPSYVTQRITARYMSAMAVHDLIRFVLSSKLGVQILKVRLDLGMRTSRR